MTLLLELTQEEIKEYNFFVIDSITKEDIQEIMETQISLAQLANNFSSNKYVTSSAEEIRQQIKLFRLVRDERKRIENSINLDDLDFGDSK